MSAITTAEINVTYPGHVRVIACFTPATAAECENLEKVVKELNEGSRNDGNITLTFENGTLKFEAWAKTEEHIVDELRAKLPKAPEPADPKPNTPVANLDKLTPEQRATIAAAQPKANEGPDPLPEPHTAVGITPGTPTPAPSETIAGESSSGTAELGATGSSTPSAADLDAVAKEQEAKDATAGESSSGTADSTEPQS